MISNYDFTGLRDSLGLNSTFSKGNHHLNNALLPTTTTLNSTYDKGQQNSTFDKGHQQQSTIAPSPPGGPKSSSGLNSTYQKISSQNNTTFDINSTSSPNNATFDISPTINNYEAKSGSGVKGSRSSSQDNDLEDRLSSTSDSSMSHRLNDLGDVQHLARMQEESKYI